MQSQEFKKKSRDEAITWVLRLHSETVNPEDHEAFKIWLAKDPQNQLNFERLATQWQSLDQLKDSVFPLRHEALGFTPPTHRHRRQLLGYAVAATAILGLGINIFIHLFWHSSDSVYATLHGQQQTVNLADGSFLELNSDTEIHIHYNDWKRSVELIRGEVFFSIVHDEDRPFVVTAANGKIEDLGTEFDVYLQDEKVMIGVESGEVLINAGENRKLSAKQMLAYDRSGDFITTLQEEIENFTAWRHGQLIFDNRRLDFVLAELERYHHIKFNLANPELAKLKVSGRFKLERLDSVLAMITSTLPIAIQHTKADEVMLKKRN